jgi:hypothetical protein
MLARVAEIVILALGLEADRDRLSLSKGYDSCLSFE